VVDAVARVHHHTRWAPRLEHESTTSHARIDAAHAHDAFDVEGSTCVDWHGVEFVTQFHAGCVHVDAGATRRVVYFKMMRPRLSRTQWPCDFDSVNSRLTSWGRGARLNVK
jgi:hypothetical protein